MEDVLEVYHRPYDPKRPLVCFDEGMKQQVKETRCPLPAASGQVAKYDFPHSSIKSCKQLILGKNIRFA